MSLLSLAVGLMPGRLAFGETCTTQSAMAPAERESLAASARKLAAEVAAGDATGVKASTIAEFQTDFSGIAQAVTSTAKHLAGATASVEQLYLLDASKLVRGAKGEAPDAQFFCTLNRSQAEADFAIPQLPPGRYAFAMVDTKGAESWRLSFLLRQEGAAWQLAGFYPKPLTAGAHDGLWYWREARTFAGKHDGWTAWLFFQEAQSLLQPASFVSSTHLEKLGEELSAAAPPAVANGLSADAPLAVRGPDGSEYRFTAVTVNDSLGPVDVAARLKVDALGDATAARKRNAEAMAALLAAYPELRKNFHGVWIFAEAPGQPAYATEQAMADIH